MEDASLSAHQEVTSSAAAWPRDPCSFTPPGAQKNPGFFLMLCCCHLQTGTRDPWFHFPPCPANSSAVLPVALVTTPSAHLLCGVCNPPSPHSVEELLSDSLPSPPPHALSLFLRVWGTHFLNGCRYLQKEKAKKKQEKPQFSGASAFHPAQLPEGRNWFLLEMGKEEKTSMRGENPHLQNSVNYVVTHTVAFELTVSYLHHQF